MATVYFAINLLQDVNVARPLAILARSMGYAVTLLVSDKFRRRDSVGLWWGEIETLVSEFGMTAVQFEGLATAYFAMQGAPGALIACSESSLPGHDLTHELHRAAPANVIRITLQHGFECVGFLHNQAHDRAHGSAVRFAADIICGWSEGRLASVAPSERPKLRITGPTSQLIPQPRESKPSKIALVCENLHSVRLNSKGTLKASFMDIFGAFVDGFTEGEGMAVLLRPHPGGRYTVKNNVPLPGYVNLNLDPIYRTPLATFAFGVSAPSSVVIDMVLAGLPVGLWQDEDRHMDIGNYRGLTIISSARDWLSFARDVELRRDMILARQNAFLTTSGLVHEPAEVRARYSKLLAMVMAAAVNATPARKAG